MRRGNLFILVALVAAVLITPSIAMAAAPSATNFKGKAAVYYRTSSAYFVVSFTCSGGTLSGKWTWETSSGVSYSGTLTSDDCALSGTNGGPWSSSFGVITLHPQGGVTTATLKNLTLSNISATKTYVINTTTCSGTADPCIEIQTSGLGAAVVPQADNDDFDSLPTVSLDNDAAPYGTLNLTLPKH